MTEQRFPVYRPIHKAMRHILFSTTRTLGLTDFRDERMGGAALEGLERTITMLREHAEHENAFVHPPLESRAPGITASFGGNHDEDEAVYAELEQLAGRIRTSQGDQRVALGNQVHDRFNTFVGEYLGHLHREETELQQALWDHFTDDELAAIEHELMGSVPPDRMGEWMKEIFASLNPDDITPMFLGMKAGAPPEAFAGAFQLAEQVMPPANWEKVRARIA